METQIWKTIEREKILLIDQKTQFLDQKNCIYELTTHNKFQQMSKNRLKFAGMWRLVNIYPM